MLNISKFPQLSLFSAYRNSLYIYLLYILKLLCFRK